MSTNSTQIAIGSEEAAFKLNIGKLQELQDHCDMGPVLIFHALAPTHNENGDLMMQNIPEVKWLDYILKLGLEGAGHEPQKVKELMDKMDDLPMMEKCFHCLDILSAALNGRPEEEALLDTPESTSKKNQ